MDFKCFLAFCTSSEILADLTVWTQESIFSEIVDVEIEEVDLTLVKLLD